MEILYKKLFLYIQIEPIFTENAASRNCTWQNEGRKHTGPTEVKTVKALEKNSQLSVNRNIKLICKRI